jgi:hypothetical protein
LYYAGEREDIDPCRTSGLQHSSRLSDRRASCQDVIDQQQRLALQACSVRHTKRISHVPPALIPAQLDLGARPARALQHLLPHNASKLPRQPRGENGRLVELPPHQAAAMEGHRDQGVKCRPAEMGLEVGEGQLQEWSPQREFASILQQMDGLP